jgi:hypothetical protein
MPSDSEDEDDRRVHFGKTIYIQIPNEWEDRDARCNHWAVDRARFRHRIREISKRIGWIFCPRHHDIIYNSRHVQ